MTLYIINKCRSTRIAGVAALALLIFLSAGAAGSASNSTAAGDLILSPDKIFLDPWYSGDSQDCPGNVTLLKEGYMLSIDSLNFTNIPAKDGMWGKTIWIANFSLYKNGEVIKRSYLTHGDIVKEINLTYDNIFYYNKTIDGKEYTIIEAKLDAIFLTESCGTVLAILRPFYQYSDGTGAVGEEIPASATGVPPSEEWNRTFGGPGSDSANSVQQTSDGGYVLAGQTYVSGVYAVWLIKTDVNGNQQWNRTFGGRKTGVDSAESIQQARDGGYIIAGGEDFSPINHSSKIWLIKTDANGSQQWDKTFKGEESWASSVQQTRDGGYIIAGSYNAYFGGAWLIKTDSNGTEQWNKIFRGQFLSARSVQQTSDGGYIIAGWIYRDIGNDTFKYAAWLIKTDADGNEQWNRMFGGIQSDQDYANDVKQTLDGGYIIAGRTESALNPGAWLIKADANGNQQWKKTFGFPIPGIISNPYDFKSIELVSDGGYITAGWTVSGDGTSDAWLVKTDANGSLLWSKTFGGSNSDYVNAVKQTLDGGYVLAGRTNSYGAGDTDVWLVKVGGESTKTSKTPAASPTETHKVSLAEKSAGFEAALAITILLAVYTARRKRW
ncbi:MAG: hypothetical protein OIN66_06980 [Candidatus Methanoperedens sp.]|nr:hypothetical protein [Candidatus Methanoperedens sp.]